ncbi:hypothetical protein K492DRAFT_239541 [Lichtheimia hyalospora FSU 10163]|nr:hypothetical protein K492DRAFT_239541 [Lichtheimia hyalospora FSU 10163]
MFFETTYVPSPQLSATSTVEEVDDLNPPPLSPSVGPAQGDSSCDEGMSDSPVDHVIFVIHGIGQQTEEYGHFYEHIDNLRETTRQVLQAKVPDHAVRIELIPIEWHRHIHEQTDPTMGRITLKSIPTIRLIENEYLADILFYFSKERGQSIIDYVTHLFNTSYHNFLEKHPDFAGKIAIIGYSLGGIITYDILSHQREPSSPQEQAEYRKIDVKFPKLDFKPNYFFGFGSPLGAMLTIRGQSPKYYHIDEDIVFENVFHPFDPLAYRFEPLLEDSYTEEPAVLVDRSIPIGPTFSFPSIPSLPGASILSFFSWRGWSQQQQERREQGLPEENLQDTAEGIQRGEPMLAESRQQQPQQSDLDPSDQAQQEQEETNRFISSVNAMFQYFSSSPSNKTSDQDEQHGPSNEPGIITWDPLKDQIRNIPPSSHPSQQPQPATNDYEDDRSKSADQLNATKKQRPVMRTRSMTFDPAYPKTHNKQYMEKDMEATDDNVTVMPDKKAKHLVEVLGIDGVRMESFERAKQNFRPVNTPTPPDIADNEEQQEQQPPPHAKLPGGRRIDHVLQPESFMSMIANEYLVGLRAHFSYWTNKDLLWHIVRRLEDLQEATADTSSTKEQKTV